LEDFFLIYGFFPWNRSPFKEIKPLSGSILEWHDGHINIQTVEKSDPWQNRFSDIDFNNATEEEVIDLLYDGFMLATEDQLASSEGAAVLLGGVDSALVVSALKRLGKKIETFSFYYDNSQFNQTHTDTLAEYLKIKHNWIHITEEVIRDGLLTYSLKFNRPTNWPNYLIQTEYLCSEIRKREFLNCYTGDGCDHVFLGYPRTHVMSKLFNSPIMIPQVILKLILNIAQWSLLEYYSGRLYHVALSIIRNFARERHVRGHIYFSIFDELSLKRLRAEPPPDHEKGIEDILKNLSEGLQGLSPDRLTYHGKSSASANKAKMLGSSNSSGITILSPYLHPGMANIARQLPDHLLRPEKKTASAVTGKYILMKMAEKKKLLPYEVIYQKKIAAVDAPIDDWYFGPLKNFMMEIMQGLPFKYNENYIKQLLTPKLAEDIYRKYLSSDHLTSHGLSLLATYASFTKALK
jgi:asparagine synthase (glutamine-hydrolysing)